MVDKCMELISAQQGGDREDNLYWLGEQLKDIVRATPGAAELVAADIGQPGMGLADAEKKLKEYADGHKRGNRACVPPPVADGILRKFYGLPGADEAGAPAAPPAAPAKAVNIMDYL